MHNTLGGKRMCKIKRRKSVRLAKEGMVTEAEGAMVSFSGGENNNINTLSPDFELALAS